MKINQLKAGVILTYLMTLLGNGIAIFYTPIMLNLLGQSEYGLYQLAISVVSYLGLLTLGLGSSYIRFYSGFKAENDEQGVARLNGMFFIIYVVVGIVAFICGIILILNFEQMFHAKLTIADIEIAKVLMFILIINLALSFPFSVFNSYTMAHERFIFQRTLELMRVVSTPLLSLPVLFYGYGAIGITILTSSINISICFFYLIYAIKVLKMKFIFRGFDFKLLKEMLIFSSFIFINIIVDKINWNVDKFLLGIYQGTTAIAIYSIASQLNSYYLVFSTTISSVFAPRVNQLVHRKDADRELNELFVKTGRIQCVVLLLLLSGLVFFGKAFITLWIGEDYLTAYYITLILVSPLTLPLMQTLGIEIQRAKNLHKFKAYVYLAIAIVNICISIPLTKAYSGIGSATGTAIAVLLCEVIIMNIYYHKKCGLNIIAFWKEIFKFIPATIVFCAVGAYINLNVIIDSWLLLLSYIALYTFVFILSMWILGLNKFEKELFSKPVLKLFRK